MRSSPNPVTTFAEAVAAEKIPAGRYERLAAERHLRDLSTSPRSGFKWSWPTAEKACRLVQMQRHYKGPLAGQRIQLEAWQTFVVGSIFGWLCVESDLRRFLNAFCELPRGNGKSTLVGCVGNKMAFFDDEPGADVFTHSRRRKINRKSPGRRRGKRS